MDRRKENSDQSGHCARTGASWHDIIWVKVSSNEANIYLQLAKGQDSFE